LLAAAAEAHKEAEAVEQEDTATLFRSKHLVAVVLQKVRQIYLKVRVIPLQ
jgi:hypothetical protein